MPTIRQHHPDVIFAPVKLDGASIIPLLGHIHSCYPEIKVIVLGDELDHDELLPLGRVGIDGYLLWSGLDSLVLHRSLAAVLEAGLRVGSPAAVEAIMTPPTPKTVLTPLELAVLRHMVAGLAQHEIAEAEHVSLRTVERTIDTLKEKLAVPTAFALGVKALRLGIIT
jgi:two-component system nitrate/nitrite response regulator NarL